ARKRLRNFVGKGGSVRLLKWAADGGLGHMAFLKAGGEQLVYDALEFAAKGPYRFGTRLDEMLGAEAAERFLQFVLRTCSEGMLRDRPESLIRDEIRTELSNYFRSAQQGLLDFAVEHASVMVEIAGGVRDTLMPGASDRRHRVERNARRAKEWEG